MRTSLEFKNGFGHISLVPEDEWERILLGALTKGSGNLEASVEYKPHGHYTNNKCEVIKVLLSPLSQIRGNSDPQ